MLAKICQRIVFRYNKLPIYQYGEATDRLEEWVFEISHHVGGANETQVELQSKCWAKLEEDERLFSLGVGFDGVGVDSVSRAKGGGMCA